MKTPNSFRAVVILLFVSINSVLLADSIINDNDNVVIIGNTFADQLRAHGYLETLLAQEANISLKNLAWAGDMVSQRDRPTNFPEEAGRLEEHKTDAIIACFGMGESFNGPEGINLFKANLENLFKSYQGKIYNGKSPVKLVLVSPIAYENHGQTTPNIETRNRDLATYTKAMQEVAEKLNINFVDLYNPAREMFSNLKETQLTSNGIHLKSIGYWALSKEIFKQLTGANSSPWLLTLDANNLEVQATGVEVFDVAKKDNSLTFKVYETNKPTLIAPKTYYKLSEIRSLNADKLTVNNLKSGAYTLIIDGEVVTTATASEWGEGIILDQTPTHQALEKLRLKINEKNLQFIYSWKALNQVHIVGERKSSKSGLALPAEVIEFNKISQNLQQQVVETSIKQTRDWSIIPATSK